jgi:hypothetical protein
MAAPPVSPKGPQGTRRKPTATDQKNHRENREISLGMNLAQTGKYVNEYILFFQVWKTGIRLRVGRLKVERLKRSRERTLHRQECLCYFYRVETPAIRCRRGLCPKPRPFTIFAE